jgi:hypothetical protein
MKTRLIIFALFFTTAVLMGQENKKTTVRIKKVENVNGVERRTDTTYTVDGPLNVADLQKFRNDRVNCNDKKGQRTIIITDGVSGDPKDMQVVTRGEGMDERLEEALKAAGTDGDAVEKIVLMNVDENKADGKKEKKQVKVVIVRKMQIVDATAEDAQLLSKTTGLTDGQLAADNVKFYPNPNDGKFNLSFLLKEKGDTEVKILNMEGKLIFKESLPDFSGTYNEAIDISKEPKGTYFVRISQGEHAQLKKIVLE